MSEGNIGALRIGVVSSVESGHRVKVRPLGIGDSDAVTPPLQLQKIVAKDAAGKTTAVFYHPEVAVGDTVCFAMFADGSGVILSAFKEG